MKLWKLFTSALITWNTFGIILLLWRYQGTWDRKSRKLEQVWLRNVDHGTEVVPTSKVDLQSPDSLERHVIPTMRTSDSRKFREEHLNVPPIYLNRSRLRLNRRPTKVKTPLFFPDIQDLKFNNIYWQTTMILETTFYLYGAYHDDRKLNQNGQGPALIRILGMVDHMPPPLNVKCAFWFDEGKRMIWSTWISYEHLWRRYWGNVRNGTLQPLLISCALPPQDGLPEMVSLVGVGTRKPSTNLRIQKHFSMVQKDFGVCVKGLDFPTLDLSLKLLEWAHLLRLLGADRIFFYELEVHPNVAIVLDYLESKEMAEVIPLTLPGYQPNQSLLRNVYLQRMMGVKRLNEIIPYNDCLYRNLHRYRFLLLLDIDEVIMPISSDSWMGLMRQVHSIIELNKPKAYKAASYNVRNVYFFDDLEHNGEEMAEIPPYLHMSRHVLRAAEFTKPGRYIKCFHDVSRVQALHNHYPFSCLSGYPCNSFDISPYMAQLQHYRKDCHDIKMSSCLQTFKNTTVLDTNIWRFKDDLMQAVSKDLDNLRLVWNR